MIAEPANCFPLADGEAFGFLIPTVLTLLGVAVLIGLVAVVRKRFMLKDDVSDTAGGFSLGGLRDLVRQGKMTQEEYDRAKEGIVAATQRRIARDAAERAAAAEKALRAPTRGRDGGMG